MALTRLVPKRRGVYLLVILAVLMVVLGIVAVLSVRARAPRPRPEPMPTPTSTPLPVSIPTVTISPQENVEPGDLIVIEGEGLPSGEEVSVDLVGSSGVERFVAAVTVAKDGTFVVPFFFPTEMPWAAEASVLAKMVSSPSGYEATLVVLMAGSQEEPTSTATVTAPPIETSTPSATPSPTATVTVGPTSAPTPTSTRAPEIVPTATSTPAVMGWRGEYYSNRFLSGAPVLVRDDPNLNFLWGAAAPAADLPADSFSARWTRTVALDGGAYRFYATSDDGVRVWVDGVLVIDQWLDAPSVTHAADRVLASGSHSLRVDYYENAGAAQIRVWWERLGEFSQWRGEYFPRIDLTGSSTLVRNDADVNFNWEWNAPASGLPADGFSVRWTRSLWFDEARYRFHAVMDDGARVYVDNQLVIDAWRDGVRREVTGDRSLSAGSHTVRVEYYERTGEASIRVWWEEVAAYPDWRGEYWSNRALNGSPTLVRNDASIDFNWGSGSPAPTIPSSDFSARWTRTRDFDAATYRFHVLVDDGARMWVDGKLIIDAWGDGSVREFTKDRTLAQGPHALEVSYYERGGEARIRVWWEKVPTSISDWKGEYWSNRRLDGTPALVRNDKEIDFDWGQGAVAPALPTDGFSARWRRDVTFSPGIYRFRARADDGIRVYLDGELIVDEWRDSDGDRVYKVDRSLTGQHALKVEYYERSGEARVEFWWERIGNLPTPTPTATPTSTPTRTPTQTPTATPTQAPTEEPTATPTPTPTATPSPKPKPTSTPTPTPTFTPASDVRLNEVMPVPGLDGVADEFDEWVEVTNIGSEPVDLSDWFLDDGVGGSEPYRVPEGTVVEPGKFLLFHGRTTGIALDDAGDTVRLLDPDELVIDTVVFGQLAANASYSRDSEGLWHDDWVPSPGAVNMPPATTLAVRSGAVNLGPTVGTWARSSLARMGGLIP